MAGTLTALRYHIVFSTKGRRQYINAELQPRLHDYLGGVVRAMDGAPIAVGGTADHVHVLATLPADCAVSTALRTIKSNSSRWIHETFPTHGDFGWQSGYAAFTVSTSKAGDVEAYVRNQVEHHRTRSFDEELWELVVRNGIAYDPRYLLDQ